MSDMAKKNLEDDEIVKPIRITDKKGVLGETGAVYELDFSRESALYAVDHGVIVTEGVEAVMKHAPFLFYASFRKNHRSVPKEKIDKLRECAKGISGSMVETLLNLLMQALASNTVQSDEDFEKNEFMTVEV